MAPASVWQDDVRLMESKKREIRLCVESKQLVIEPLNVARAGVGEKGMWEDELNHPENRKKKDGRNEDANQYFTWSYLNYFSVPTPMGCFIEGTFTRLPGLRKMRSKDRGKCWENLGSSGNLQKGQLLGFKPPKSGQSRTYYEKSVHFFIASGICLREKYHQPKLQIAIGV